MSRYLIAWWAGGNLPPAHHLGAQLLWRGHRVRPIGWAGMAARAAQAGLEFTAYLHVPPWSAGVVLEHGWARLEDSLCAPNWRICARVTLSLLDSRDANIRQPGDATTSESGHAL